jgi:hypothetical protein
VAVTWLVGRAVGVRGLLRDKRVRWCGAVLVWSVVAAMAWIIGSKTLAVDQTYDDLSQGGVIAASWHHVVTYWRWVFGAFGWLDTNPPDVVPIGWFAAWVVLASVGFAMAGRWMRVLMLGLLTGGLLLPIAIQAQQWNGVGPAWQGRYALPLLVGVPILAGWIIDRSEVAHPLRSLRTSMVVGLSALHAIAYYAAIRRYVVGATGRVWFLGRGHSWLGGSLVPVTVGGLLAIALVGAGLVAIDLRGRPEGDVVPEAI